MSPLCDARCQMKETELWAYTNPGKKSFTDTLTKTFADSITKYFASDKGSVCRWQLIAADKEEVIKLSFSDFSLKHASGDEDGDCVEVYDGDSTLDTQLADICGNDEPGDYRSSGREMLVVYRRGEVGGSRSFVLEYKTLDVLSRDKIIRIAGGIGAVLGTLVLIFLICKFTKCCSCCFKQKDESTFVETPPEATQLTSDNTDCHVTTIDDHVIYSNVNNTAEAPLAEDEFEETALESDTESLHQFNNVPPSYESLYLTEDGIEISPPEYQPPKHKERLPPRRVHTFN